MKEFSVAVPQPAKHTPIAVQAYTDERFILIDLLHNFGIAIVRSKKGVAELRQLARVSVYCGETPDEYQVVAVANDVGTDLDVRHSFVCRVHDLIKKWTLAYGDGIPDTLCVFVETTIESPAYGHRVNISVEGGDRPWDMIGPIDCENPVRQMNVDTYRKHMGSMRDDLIRMVNEKKFAWTTNDEIDTSP